MQMTVRPAAAMKILNDISISNALKAKLLKHFTTEIVCLSFTIRFEDHKTTLLPP